MGVWDVLGGHPALPRAGRHLLRASARDSGSAGRGWEGGPVGAEWPLPSAGGLGGSWKLLTMDRDLMVAQFSTPSLPPSLVSAGGPRPGQEELRSAPAKPASQQVGGQGDPAAWSANCPLGLPCTERAPAAAPWPLAEQSAETAPRTEGYARLCMDQPTVGVRATPAGGGDGSALRELHPPTPPTRQR